MSKYIGREVSVGIGRETSRGTPKVSSYWIPWRTFDVEDKITAIPDAQAYGVIEDSTGLRVVSKWAEGALSGVVRHDAIGVLLLATFGTPVDVSGVEVSGTPEEATAYEHTFTVYQTHEHPSFTIEVADPVEGDVAFPLAMINSLEIAADLNEFVLFTANVMSSPSQATPVTAAYTTTPYDFIAEDMEIRTADDYDGLAAAPAKAIKSTTLTIEKGLEKDDILGSTSPNDFLNKVVMANVVIRKSYEGVEFKDSFTTGSPIALRVEMEDTRTTIGYPADKVYPKLTFNLNQTRITDWSAARDLDGILIEEFTAKGSYKISEATPQMIEAKLINLIEKY